jgi:hypothetical protein
MLAAQVYRACSREIGLGERGYAVPTANGVTLLLEEQCAVVARSCLHARGSMMSFVEPKAAGQPNKQGLGATRITSTFLTSFWVVVRVSPPVYKMHGTTCICLPYIASPGSLLF